MPANGRPTRLTDEVFDTICTAVRAGNYFTVAAQHAGISPETASHWQRRGTPGTSDYESRGPYTEDQLRTIAACPTCHGEGREPGARSNTTRRCRARCNSGVRRGFDRSTLDPADGLFARFAREVARARADAEAHAVGVLRQAMVIGDWRAAEAFLKRARPERWREEVAVDSDVTTHHTGTVRITTDETRSMALVRAMEEADLFGDEPEEPDRSNGHRNGAAATDAE